MVSLLPAWWERGIARLTCEQKGGSVLVLAAFAFAGVTIIFKDWGER